MCRYILPRWFIWLALIAFIVLSHMNGLTANYDDLSVLRASAYLSRDSAETLHHELQSHLEVSRPELDAITYQRYAIRLETPQTYPFSNLTVPIFDQLPQATPYQSVALSNLLLLLLASTTLFATIDWLFKSCAPVLQLALFASLLPQAFVFNINQTLLPIPFQAASHTWFVTVARGAALQLAITAILMIVAWQTGKLSSKKAALAIVVLLLFAAVAHVTMALMLAAFLVSCIVLVASRRFDLVLLAGKWRARRILLLFNSSIVLMALAKIVFLWGAGMRYIRPNFNVMLWLIPTNLLLVAWIHNRRQHAADHLLIVSNDWLMRFFVPLSIFAIGYNLFQPTVLLRWGDLFVFTEAGMRMLALPQVLWWMIAGLLLYLRWGQNKVRAMRLSGYLLIGLIGAALIGRFIVNLPDAALNRPELESVRITEILRDDPSVVYKDEARYFQSIANELSTEK